MDHDQRMTQADLRALRADFDRLVHELSPYAPSVIHADVPQGADGTDPPLRKKLGVMAFIMGDGEGGGETFVHPFKITTSVDGTTPKYTIAKGSITDGTNGTAVDLTGIIETETTATAGFVVIEADVDASLVITGWALAIKTTAADADEVGMTTAGTIRQDKIRLLIGKLTLADGIATSWQAQFNSVRITHGILNGIAVKVFETAPTHPDVI